MASEHKSFRVNTPGDTDFETISQSKLQPDNVTIAVEFSSLNYKDVLAAAGNKAIVSALPHIPGIDASGTVVESNAANISVGDKVLVAHADFGTRSNGGFSQRISVPSQWVYKLNSPVDTRTAMIFGTAGFTAAMSAMRIIDAGIEPNDGPIAITGATGGVGSMAIFLLNRLGYEVVAISGKRDSVDWLTNLGADSVIERSHFSDVPNRPMLKGQFAAGVDTVGGGMLETLIKSTLPGGIVTACGMVAGTDLSLTVFPFILRGVTLGGIDSANIDRQQRLNVWKWIEEHLSKPIDTKVYETLYQEVPFEKLPEILAQLKNGTHQGRTLIDMGAGH